MRFTVRAARDRLNGMDDPTPKPHPKNAPGPFYVIDGCCTACDVPVSEAPGLFAYDETNHCFVKRQPSTPREFDRAFLVAWAAELECIRYRGDDPQMLRRFAELGQPDLCDIPPPPEVRPVVRDLVTFDTKSLDHAGISALELADAFQRSVRHRMSNYQLRFNPITGNETCATLTFAWFEENYHSVEFCVTNKANCRWLVRHDAASRAGGRGLSREIDEWLRGAQHFCDLRWYSADGWSRGEEWRDSPL